MFGPFDGAWTATHFLLAFPRRQCFHELLSIILVTRLLYWYPSQDAFNVGEGRLRVLLHGREVILPVAKIDTLKVLTEFSHFLLKVSLPF